MDDVNILREVKYDLNEGSLDTHHGRHRHGR